LNLSTIYLLNQIKEKFKKNNSSRLIESLLLIGYALALVECQFVLFWKVLKKKLNRIWKKHLIEI